ALRRQECIHSPDEVALEFMLILHAQFFYSRLYLSACLPLVLDCFIASDVDKVAGEKPDDLAQDILHKLNRLFARVEDVGADAPMRPDLERLAFYTELRVSGDGCLCVARHLDLGHNRNVSLTRVLNNLFDLVLRVEPSVAHLVEPVSISSLVTET